MMATSVPTVPTTSTAVGTTNVQQNKGCSDRSDCSDRKVQGWGGNNVALSALALRWRSDLDHDADEAKAMTEHYAAPANPVLPDRDPVAEGLLRGFWAHRGGRPA